MPQIQHLTIENFRNLTSLSYHCSPQFNVFYGHNGSGKTSLLEAIYYLGLGKSFRSAQCARIIQHNTDRCRIIARVAIENTSSLIGIERNRDGERTIKQDGDLQNSMIPITRLIPMQFMSPMSYRFFHDGPKLRRQYIDWALFHVEPSFLETWQRFQRLLKQRNSAIKTQQDLHVWDKELSQAAHLLDTMRQSITDQIKPVCLHMLKILLPNVDFSLRYQRGWPAEIYLLELLKSNLYRDKQLGYTFYGPQRADFQLIGDSIPVQDSLSQGQQKLAAYALHLTLGIILQQMTGVSPLYLIDDLPSELDSNSRSLITQTLNELNSQVFITGISADDLEPLLQLDKTQLFHVEHGTIHTHVLTS